MICFGTSVYYHNLSRSKLTPPDCIFAFVWSILYTVLFISVIGFATTEYTDLGMILFILQLLANCLWVPLFMWMHRPLLALCDLVVLWFLLGAMIWVWPSPWKYVNIPYFAWVTFAGYLNWFIVSNN